MELPGSIPVLLFVQIVEINLSFQNLITGLQIKAPKQMIWPFSIEILMYILVHFYSKLVRYLNIGMGYKITFGAAMGWN